MSFTLVERCWGVFDFVPFLQIKFVPIDRKLKVGLVVRCQGTLAAPDLLCLMCLSLPSDGVRRLLVSSDQLVLTELVSDDFKVWTRQKNCILLKNLELFRWTCLHSSCSTSLTSSFNCLSMTFSWLLKLFLLKYTIWGCTDKPTSPRVKFLCWIVIEESVLLLSK